MDTAQQVAQALLAIGAVGFVPEKPLTFKSGIVSPVYVDNRKFPFHPNEWKGVIKGFAHTIKHEGIKADVIAGVEAAGIPHSAALGFFMGTPSVFVRKQAKDHGTKKLVEGGQVAGKHVVLIEDLVTTGGSSLASIAALRAEGAIAEQCLVIVTYGFGEAEEAFRNANVRLHSLTNFSTILTEAEKSGALSTENKKVVENFLADPHGWGAKRGLS